MKQFLFILILLLIYTPLYAGRLAGESSPYLRAHDHNPVDWYPYSDEAFDTARRQNKPIFISIGFSTCHWCHVMERESFMSDTTAALINKYFISIKVDREERPDIDSHYQQIYKKLKGKSGGWPLSAFITPDKKLIYIDGYIPKEDNGRKKGFAEIVTFLTNDSPQIEVADEKRIIASFISRDLALEYLLAGLDTKYGGFGQYPKFPSTSPIRLAYSLNSSSSAEIVEKTLDGMYYSGLYDHVEGGFFRYSVDKMWHIPHFEKMLYTNAELIGAYALGYLLTKKDVYKRVISGVVNNIEYRFGHDGLFYSASNADSEGGEGAYYMYSYSDTETFSREMRSYLDISEFGNFEDGINHIRLTSAEAPAGINRALLTLRVIRESREYPFIDRKIINSWNSLYVKNLFIASAVDKRYLSVAERALNRLYDKFVVNGKVYHSYLEGYGLSKTDQFEDYAYLSDALLTGYRYTFKQKYFDNAEKLAKKAVELFYKGGRFSLSVGLPESSADYDDKYITSPASVMVSVLSDLSAMGKADYRVIVDEILADAEVLDYKNSELINQKLKSAYGVVILKSSRENLLREMDRISAAALPYTVLQVQKTDQFLACTEEKCFAFSTDINDVIEKIYTYRNMLRIGE